MDQSANELRGQPAFVIAGRLQRDTILPAQGRPLIDVPGGNLLYTAAGLNVWLPPLKERLPGIHLGLLARIGEDYPREWLRSFENLGWDTRGIHILSQALDLRFFQATLPDQTVHISNPLTHFARLALTFPKNLLGYQPPNDLTSNPTSPDLGSPRPTDIPADYFYARAAHMCPLDYSTALRLSSAFREAAVTTITIDPSISLMATGMFEQVRTLLNGLTAFIPSERKLRSLFWGQTNDLWQMAEALGGCGCELIIVKCGAHGQILYDSVSKKRWEIPAYPARLADLAGAGDSFCGGFLAGYQRSYDPVRAVLQGSVSASLAIEGYGAFHALDALPALAQARLESLTALVRPV